MAEVRVRAVRRFWNRRQLTARPTSVRASGFEFAHLLGPVHSKGELTRQTDTSHVVEAVPTESTSIAGRSSVDDLLGIPAPAPDVARPVLPVETASVGEVDALLGGSVTAFVEPSPAPIDVPTGEVAVVEPSEPEELQPVTAAKTSRFASAGMDDDRLPLPRRRRRR